jgi:hypothetical protein
LNKTSRFILQGNKITLFVKKSSLFVRMVFILLAFLCVGLPFMGIVLNAQSGSDFHIKYIIVLGVFSLIGFYFLRLFLWNTYGKEVIEIKNSSVTYYADYRYFKGNQQQLNFQKLSYDFVAKGFVEQQIGNLLFVSTESDFIESAVDLPIPDLIKIITLLSNDVSFPATAFYNKNKSSDATIEIEKN